MKLFTIQILIALSLLSFSADKKITAEEYIEKYKEDAIKEMKRSGVPASITLAQGMLESGNGNSRLAKKAKNHFGIKCHSDWSGATFRMDDDAKNECFRKYKSVWHSFRDHSDFLKGKKRYASLFTLKITDYKGWCKGLKKAGYATNRQYANLLIKIIERHDLNQYVKGAKKKSKRAKRKEKKEKLAKNPGVVKDSLADDGFEVTFTTSRVKTSDNWIKYVDVKKGDTYFSLAKENKIPLSRLYKYNECNADTTLEIGSKVYLQPKKRKAKLKSYTFKDGDKLYQISQQHGIKMKYLYKRNNWPADYQPKDGEVILLRGKKKRKR